MPAGLSMSDNITVSVMLTPIGLQFRNFGVICIAGPSNVIDVSQRIRVYTNISGVLADFSNTSPEYLASAVLFSQTPQPTQVEIGRWAQAATSAVLHTGQFSIAAQATLLTALQAISTGTMSITVDGTVCALTALNFSSITTLNGAAAILQTALSGIKAGAKVNFMPDSISCFNFYSGTTGTGSTITYGTTQGTGVDVSALLQTTAVTGASTPVNGIAAESALTCATVLTGPTQLFGSYAFAFAPISFSQLADSDHEAVAGYIEALSPSHSYWATSNEAGIISSTSTTDLASVLQSLGYNHTYLQYSSSSPYAAIAAFAKFSVIDPTASNSMITLKFKTETGIIAETLTESQAAALTAKNCNVFVNYATPQSNINSVTAILQQGVMVSGQFADTVWGADWLQNNVQYNIFNLFYQTPTKIPQTESGVNQYHATVTSSLAAAVNNGWCAPGIWNGPSFGQLLTGQNLPLGYYIYTPPLASQPQANRAARQAPVMQCAVKLAGAMHSANVIINVNP
jgi:hypothetical protein